MQSILAHLKKFKVNNAVSAALNIGGVFLIFSGILTLPVHYSFRLLLCGAVCVVLWMTLSE